MKTGFPAGTALETYQTSVPEHAFDDVRGWRWHYRDRQCEPGHAAATPLLLLPGAAGTGDMACQLALALGEARRVLSITYPSGASATELADGLAQLAAHLELAPAAVWTSSYAAWWIQAFAARHADRLAALWLGNGFVDREAVAALPLFDLAWLRTHNADAVREAWLAATRRRPEGELKNLLLRMLERELPAAALRARLIEVAQSEALEAVHPGGLPEGAVVVSHCLDDTIIGAAERERVRSAWPRAVHHALETGGHYPHVTHPHLLLPALKRWLAASNQEKST